MVNSGPRIERVFLLFPPIRLYRETMKLVFAPLGVSYLAAMIRNDVEVKIMDAVSEGFNNEDTLDDEFITFGSDINEIRRRIEEFQPQMVGITCLFSSVFPVIRRITRLVKEINPEIITITGGTYPTFLPEHCLEEESLDMICLGEGEVTLKETIQHLNQGQSLDDIDGLAFKKDGRIKVNPRTRFIKDLDSIPFPAWDLLPMSLYTKINVPHSFSQKSKLNMPVITSRGCPARCTFCSSSLFWGHRFRARSAENVLDEIGELIEHWGIKEIQFEDDNITANRNRAKAIFRGIMERGYKIHFNMPNGVAIWTLDEELIDLMKAAGCYEMTLAFESGSQEVIDKIIKKPIKLDRALGMTELIRSKGIRTNAFYIFGFPGETLEQMHETFHFARKARTDMAYFFIANPLPGTELYRIAKEADLLMPGFNFENVSFTRSSFKPGILKANELERMAGREFLKYNFIAFFRHPWIFFKKAVVDLLIRRPGYTLGLLARVYQRNLR